MQSSGLALAIADLRLAIAGQVGSALLLLSTVVVEQSSLAGIYLDSEAFSLAELHVDGWEFASLEADL